MRPFIYGELTARPSELWAVVPASFILGPLLLYSCYTGTPPAFYKTNHLIYHPTDPSRSIWLTGINPNLTMNLKRKVEEEEMSLRESKSHLIALVPKGFNSAKCQGLRKTPNPLLVSPEPGTEIEVDKVIGHPFPVNCNL